LSRGSIMLGILLGLMQPNRPKTKDKDKDKKPLISTDSIATTPQPVAIQISTHSHTHFSPKKKNRQESSSPEFNLSNLVISHIIAFKDELKQDLTLYATPDSKENYRKLTRNSFYPYANEDEFFSKNVVSRISNATEQRRMAITQIYHGTDDRYQREIIKTQFRIALFETQYEHLLKHDDETEETETAKITLCTELHNHYQSLQKIADHNTQQFISEYNNASDVSKRTGGLLNKIGRYRIEATLFRNKISTVANQLTSKFEPSDKVIDENKQATIDKPNSSNLELQIAQQDLQTQLNDLNSQLNDLKDQLKISLKNTETFRSKYNSSSDASEQNSLLDQIASCQETESVIRDSIRTVTTLLKEAERALEPNDMIVDDDEQTILEKRLSGMLRIQRQQAVIASGTGLYRQIAGIYEKLITLHQAKINDKFLAISIEDNYDKTAETEIKLLIDNLYTLKLELFENNREQQATISRANSKSSLEPERSTSCTYQTTQIRC